MYVFLQAKIMFAKVIVTPFICLCVSKGSHGNKNSLTNQRIIKA